MHIDRAPKKYPAQQRAVLPRRKSIPRNIIEIPKEKLKYRVVRTTLYSQ